MGRCNKKGDNEMSPADWVAVQEHPEYFTPNPITIAIVLIATVLILAFLLWKHR